MAAEHSTRSDNPAPPIVRDGLLELTDRATLTATGVQAILYTLPRFHQDDGPLNPDLMGALYWLLADRVEFLGETISETYDEIARMRENQQSRVTAPCLCSEDETANYGGDGAATTTTA